NEMNEKLSGFQFPLIAKIDSPQVLHKSDFGGVVAKIADMKISYFNIAQKIFDAIIVPISNIKLQIGGVVC
ncbi:MAG: hypothetical protein Q7S59_09385, partial [Sulfurimonas sp.]|nr:hypothetical protein [Sulfurimonas sp.]